jgi:hypothetical protein
VFHLKKKHNNIVTETASYVLAVSGLNRGFLAYFTSLVSMLAFGLQNRLKETLDSLRVVSE